MKKITLLFVLLTSSMLSAQTKKTAKTTAEGTLKGTVTYEKVVMETPTPDAGATVMIRKSDIVRESPQDTLTNYKSIVLTRHLYETTKDAYFLGQLEKKNAETKEKFDIIAKATFRNFYNLMKNPETITTKADAQGNYSVNLKPGRYEVVFVSATLKAVNLIESRGRIDSYFVEVRPGETKVQNNKFHNAYR